MIQLAKLSVSERSEGTFQRWVKALLPKDVRFYLRTLTECLKVQLRYFRRGQVLKALRGLKIYLAILGNSGCAFRLLPRRRDCEFCGWSGFAFIPIYYVDGYRAEVFCPRCRLMDRYRTLVHFARHSVIAKRIRLEGPRALDIAPTESSGKMLMAEFGARASLGFDISNPWADVIGDLREMPFDADSFDFFLCYEVLDYIPRDEVALKELYRVLKPDSYGFLRVGFDEKLEVTKDYRDPDADDSYHIRRYGRDLTDRLRQPGFEVDLVDMISGVSQQDRLRFGLDTKPVFLLHKPRVGA